MKAGERSAAGPWYLAARRSHLFNPSIMVWKCVVGSRQIVSSLDHGCPS